MDLLDDCDNFELPQLVLLKQDPPSICEKNNNSEKHIHTVVKNIAFEMKFGFKHQKDESKSFPSFNFNHVVFEGKLLYDTPELKEVSYIASKPFEMRRILQADGNEIRMQFRIKVLSSHHENMSFILKIQALHPITGSEMHPSMSVYSHPIRVISKPERKQPKTKTRKKAPRRKMEDKIKDALSSCVKEQNKQISIINSLTCWAKDSKLLTNDFPLLLNDSNTNTPINTNNIQTSSSIPSILPDTRPLFISSPNIGESFSSQNQNLLHSSSPSSLNFNDNITWNNNNNNESIKTIDASIPPAHAELLGNTDPLSQRFPIEFSEFSFALENFLMLYNTLDPDERHDKIRKILRNSSKQELDIISIFLSVLQNNGIKPCSQQVGCTCSYCPYEFQLQQIQLDQLTSASNDDNILPFYPE